MTAAHYIALLLLSTAAEGSREHLEIIEQNGPGIWVSLAELDLVEQDNGGGPLRLSERGRVLVDYVLRLPLPQQVNVWQMPGVSIRMPIMPAASIGEAVRRWNESGVPAGRANLQPGNADLETDGPPPPKAPPPKPIPGITAAEDPQARRAQALELMNRGYGTSEIADTLEMDAGEVEQIFFRGV